MQQVILFISTSSNRDKARRFILELEYIYVYLKDVFNFIKLKKRDPFKIINGFTSLLMIESSSTTLKIAIYVTSFCLMSSKASEKAQMIIIESLMLN